MLLLMMPLTGSAESLLQGRASVVDADTLELRETRVRLEGIDAFESSQLCPRGKEQWRCGQAAALWLDDFIGRRPIICTPTGRDRYKRVLAHCQVAGQDLGEALVRAGLALAYRRYSERYVTAEDDARRRQVGAWAPGVRFVAPWDWRRGYRR